MTVSSTTSRWEYDGDGSTTDFTYNNLIFEDSDLDVYVDGVLQTLTTDYTVTGAGTISGGEVKFVTAPANGTEVVIVRDAANTQGSDYPVGGALSSTTLESDLDRRTVIAQDQQGQIDRSLKYPETDQNSPSADLPAKADRANKYLSFDADGAPVAQDGTATDTDVSDKLVDPVGGISQQRLDVLTSKIDNLKELADATALQVDGLQVQMRAFYSDTDTGGGHFYWDADRAKSDANGGTIIDPDNVGTLSATARGTLASVQGTGTGNGVWTRLVDDHITHEDFGLRDGETGSETRVALKNCWEWAGNNGVKVVDEGNEYGVDDTLEITSIVDLVLDFSTETRIFLSAVPTTFLKTVLIRGNKNVEIYGGTWDTNGKLPTDAQASHNLMVSPAAEKNIISGGIYTGNFGGGGGDPNFRGVHIFVNADIANDVTVPVRTVTVERNTIKGLDDAAGRGIAVNGTNLTQSSEYLTTAEITNNRISGVNMGIVVANLLSQKITSNVLDVGDRGILTFGETAIATTISDVDPDKSFSNFVIGNRVQISATGGGQGGIVLGTASGPNLISANSIYMPIGSTLQGISDDTSLGLSKTYESHTVCIGNVIRGGKLGISTNATKVIYVNNHISECSDASIRMPNAAGDNNNSIVTGNICEDAPIQLGDGTGHFNIIGPGNHVFDAGRDIATNKQTIKNESFNSQHPKLVERFTSSRLPSTRTNDDGTTSTNTTNKGVAGDVWEFDTSGGAIDDWLPSSQRLQPGQEISLFKWSGTNSLALKPVEGSFVDTDVDTTNDTITITQPASNAFPELRTSASTGKPVRISNRNSGTLPSPLTADTIFYWIWVSQPNSTTLVGKLAETEADALAGTAIDLTSTGDTKTKFLGDVLYDNSGNSIASLTITNMNRVVSGRGAWYQIY